MDDIIYCEFDKLNKFTGIVDNITKKSLVVTDYIKTFSTKPYRDSECPDNTFNSANSIFTSISYINSFIGYYFPGRKLLLKHYSIKTVVLTDYSCRFPRNWAIFGSNNNRTWKKIDYRNTTIFNERGQEETFDIKIPKAFRYYKMQQMGMNSDSDYLLRFQRIEFFGVLYSDRTGLDMICNGIKQCTMRCRKRHNDILLVILLINENCNK